MAQRASVSLSILYLLLFTLLFSRIHAVPGEYDSDVIDLHQILSSFAARGQMAIELFAPLSTVIGSSLESWMMLVVGASLLWPLIAVACIASSRMLETIQSFNLRMASYILVAAIIWFHCSTGHEDLLSMHCEIADGCLILAILAATVFIRGSPLLDGLLFFGLSEALLLTSFASGCNKVDFCGAYLLITLVRMRALAKKVANSTRSALSLACEGIFSLTLSILVWPMLFLILIGALLPSSESAVGGNYNLRYLSAAARRDLTPFPSIQDPLRHAAAVHGLYEGMSYTLYVPQAGFLWSDQMMWKQSLPEKLRNQSNHYDDDTGRYWSIDGSFRAFFQDKFAERYPWTFEKLLPTIPTHERHSTQPIRSGSTVRLYDSTAARYLCVIPDEPVTSEAGRFDYGNSSESNLDRIRVGTYSEPSSPHCDWTTYFDPQQDDGVALSSQENMCSLATTFRSLPYFDISRDNNTVSRILNLKLEASCTKSANDASSRFFIIENAGQGVLPTTPKTYLGKKSYSTVISGCLWRALHYFDARRKLANFRQHYSHLQELGSVLKNIRGQERRLHSFSLDVLTCIFYALLQAFDILARRRRPVDTVEPPRLRTTCNKITACFVLLHVCAYYILGNRLPHSSRAAGLISLNGFIDYFA